MDSVKVVLGLVIFILCSSTCFGVFISNLNETCFRCLCHVTGCDLAATCGGGYCGPFYISRLYWIDAGKVTLENDDPERDEAYSDCARNYYCSIKIVEAYMAKYGKDCNGDGVTDCYDYMMINHNGGHGCTTPLSRSASGRRQLQLFKQCKF
ncbi:unnamed protein product [Plutella xylostella]|uniref:lysozyme n=1 Tax=Plutella xylostella TaxID=51655 RepID=A0A8S4FSZ7_PLUXY|nr:unnamed protein product [Plutella xylostella]